jgi:hypothetical protein
LKNIKVWAEGKKLEIPLPAKPAIFANIVEEKLLRSGPYPESKLSHIIQNPYAGSNWIKDI